MSSTVNDFSGVLVRTLTAIAGFEAKFGYWPSTLEIPESSAGALMLRHLTSRGLSSLLDKVRLEEGPDGDIRALGREGDVFSYGNESTEGLTTKACAWLGWVLPEE